MLKWLKGIGWCIVVALAAFGAASLATKSQRLRDIAEEEQALRLNVGTHTRAGVAHKKKADVAIAAAAEADKKVAERLDVMARNGHEPLRDRLADWNADRLHDGTAEG